MMFYCPCRSQQRPNRASNVGFDRHLWKGPNFPRGMVSFFGYYQSTCRHHNICLSGDFLRRQNLRSGSFEEAVGALDGNIAVVVEEADLGLPEGCTHRDHRSDLQGDVGRACLLHHHIVDNSLPHLACMDSHTYIVHLGPRPVEKVHQQVCLAHTVDRLEGDTYRRHPSVLLGFLVMLLPVPASGPPAITVHGPSSGRKGFDFRLRR